MAAAFLVEFAVAQSIEAVQQRSGPPPRPTQLWGRGGQRRQHQQALSRAEVIHALTAPGSGETQARALGVANGVAALVKYAINAEYTKQAQNMMAGAVSIWLNWDQSTHAGKDVNLCIAGSCHNENACYLRPAVLCEAGGMNGNRTWQKKGKTFSTLWGRRDNVFPAGRSLFFLFTGVSDLTGLIAAAAVKHFLLIDLLGVGRENAENDVAMSWGRMWQNGAG